MIKFETVLNSMDEGVLIVNKENKIVYFNKAYGDFIGHSLEEVKGALLTDIRPGARNWEQDILATGASLPCGYLMINEKPDSAGIESCKKFGSDLAQLL